jgi:hypothetical protein
MRGKHNNQAGFGNAGVVIAVVGVMVLGGAGYLVYRTQGKSPASAASASQGSIAQAETVAATQETKSTITPQGAVLDFKEIGIQLPLDSVVTNAVYAPYYTPSPDGAKVYGISTQELESVGSANSACSASRGPLGIIRATTTAPMKLVPPNGEAPMTPDNKTLFKIGTSYFQYVAPQEFGCTDSGKVTETDMQTAQTAVAQSFTSLQQDNAQ